MILSPDEPAAKVHRKGKLPWLFTPSVKYRKLVHITRNGTVYAILSAYEHDKPFWIGRLSNDAWCTCERELRALSIEFSCGGVYTFPL